MTDAYKLFEARIPWVDKDGRLTVAALKSLRQIVKLFGGTESQLPTSFLYVPVGGTALSFVYTAADGSITTTAVPTSGQLLIGSTGAAPVAAALTGTANQVTVTNGAGSITLSLPQNIHSGASPTFAGLLISSLATNSFIYAAASGALTSTAAPTDGQLLIGDTGSSPVVSALTGTANRVAVTNGAGSITLSTPQDTHSGASPAFAGLTLSGLTANSFIYSGASGALTTTAAPTDGQLLIGSTGLAPARASITGTANQVIVTNGAGSITLSAPQDIGTASSPTFAGLTLNGDLTLNTAGDKLAIKEGSNAAMGVATLSAGTVTVNNTLVTASSRIFLQGQNSSGTHGELTISARSAGTSFTITSTSATDTRSVAYHIVEPA